MNSNQWFAPVGIENEKNLHFRARSEFEISDVPEHCEIKVAAELRYRLWCNGQEVATGPARGTKALVFFDTHDLVPFYKMAATLWKSWSGAQVSPLSNTRQSVRLYGLSWKVFRCNGKSRAM